MIRLAVSRRHHRAGRIGRAFTLIEVLIASFIIALGVMGLLALFAGAARQQQGASQITQSVFFSNNAAAILQSNLGRLSFEDACVTPEPGRWQPVHMDRLDYFLTLAGVGGCNCQESPFFLISLPRTRLFSTNDENLFRGDLGFSDGVTPPPGIQDIGTSDFNGQVRTLPGRDLDPDSIRISISIVDTNTSDGDTSRTMEYVRPADTDLSSLYQVDDDTTIFVLPHDGDPGGPTQADANPNYVAIDVKPCTTLDGEFARLAVVSVQSGGSFNAGVLPNEYISEIVLEEGDRQSRDLVSLPDRLRFRVDESTEDGRRPEMSYGLLWRQKDSVMQALVMSYRLIAPSSAALWVPPERPVEYVLLSSNMWDDSPLRRVDLELGYDKGLQQYFVELDNDNDAWAIEPGQLLVVEGDASLGAKNAPGSDGAVQVLRQQIVGGVGSNGRTRGLLDRGPRHDGSSYLTGNELINGITAKLRFIAINDIVRSLEDGTDWRLRPLDGRVIQVAIN